jgi:hypothetical protein
MNRILYLAVGGICFGLIGVVVSEFDWTISEVAASPNETGHDERPTISQPNSADDIDKLTDEILARPLFTPSRRPPPPPVEAQEEEVEAPKTPPVLTGRLAGMLIVPNELKEAFFTRESEQSVSVKEGDNIDGWTVSSIEPDRVVLTSAFGERVVQPTFAQAARAPLRPPRPQAKVRPQPVAQGQPQRPGGAGNPNLLRPSPMPNRVNPAPVPAAVRQRPRQ